MFKKTKHGVEIDSQKADAGMKPRFGKRSAPVAPAEAPTPKKGGKPFGKKRARAKKASILIAKAQKGE